MKVAVCQLPDVQDDVARAVELMGVWTREAARQGAGLVCFPEGILQGYDLHTAHIARVAMELDSPAFGDVLRSLEPLAPIIVFGMLETDCGRYYNTAVAIERGRLRARYRKNHLLKPEQASFVAGADCPVFDAHGTSVALNICHDLAHASSVQRAAEAGARLLVCPCNNLLPRPQAETWKHRHLEIRRQRAREHGLWVATAEVTGERGDHVACGPTAIIDPRGEVIAQVPLMEVGMVVVPVQRNQGSQRG